MKQTPTLKCFSVFKLIQIMLSNTVLLAFIICLNRRLFLYGSKNWRSVINFNYRVANVLSLGNILLIIKVKSLYLCQALTFNAQIFQDLARTFRNIADKVRQALCIWMQWYLDWNSFSIFPKCSQFSQNPNILLRFLFVKLFPQLSSILISNSSHINIVYLCEKHNLYKLLLPILAILWIYIYKIF